MKKISILIMTILYVFSISPAFCGQNIEIVTAIERAKNTLKTDQFLDDRYINAELKDTPWNMCIHKNCITKRIPEDYISPLCLEIAEKLKGHTYWVVSFRLVQNTPPVVGCTFCVFIDAETGEHLASICS